jgi:hypothetical protein
LLHPFLRGKDELEFPGAAGGVWEGEVEANGESEGRVTPGRRNLDRPVERGLLPAVPTSDTGPRRMEEDNHPPLRLGKAKQRCRTNEECSQGHCHMPETEIALLPD